MSMKKASSGFRTRWANATTKTHVGIIIRRGSISGTIPMCCLNRTAAEPIVASCQGLPSVKRPIPIPLLSQPMWSRGACRTMKSTPCITTSARHSARRRLSVCSGYTASAPPPMGRRDHLLADGPAGTGADRENHAVRSRYRASDKGATGFCQLGTFRVEVAGFPFEAMSVWRTSSEKFIVSGNAGGK